MKNDETTFGIKPMKKQRLALSQFAAARRGGIFYLMCLIRLM